MLTEKKVGLFLNSTTTFAFPWQRTMHDLQNYRLSIWVKWGYSNKNSWGIVGNMGNWLPSAKELSGEKWYRKQIIGLLKG